MRHAMLSILLLSGCLPATPVGGGDPGPGGMPGGSGGPSAGGNPDQPGGNNPGGGGGGTTVSSGRVVGYFTNWAQYRPGACKFTPSNIDASLLTHINYAFAKITTSGTQQNPGTFNLTGYEWNDEGPGGQYEKVNALKTANPKLKTLISVGGWTFNDTPATNWIFSAMVSAPQSRAQFIGASIAYVRMHGFDGIDFDWEYPVAADRGGKPADKANFTAFLAELRQAITAEAQSSGKPALLVTIASAAGASHIANYELDKIHASLDWINVMTYDFHGAWESFTGANAPLMADTVPGGTFHVDYAISAYLNAGVPADKVVLGFATYGHSFGGVTATKPNSPAGGAAAQGTCTRTAGFLASYEIEQLLKAGYTRGFDTGSATPYAYDSAGNWISYDDKQSFGLKVDYLQQRKLGGAMIWALDLDDFAAGYPLVSLLAQRLGVK
jgi:chitinase